MNFAFIPQINLQAGGNFAAGSPGSVQTLAQVQSNSAAVTQVIL